MGARDDDLMGAAGLSMRQVVEDEENAAREAGDDYETPPVSIRERVTADSKNGRINVDEWDFEIPAEVARYLKPDETRAVPLRQHPARLVIPALAFAGGLAVAVALNMAAYASGRANPAAIHVLWLAWIGAAGWSLWRYYLWRQTWFVITGHRLLMIETTPALGRKIAMLPIDKLRDCEFTQNYTARQIGYATFRFSSIGTERALSEVTYVPYPEWVYQQISELTMPAEDRKAIRRNRG